MYFVIRLLSVSNFFFLGSRFKLYQFLLITILTFANRTNENLMKKKIIAKKLQLYIFFQFLYQLFLKLFILCKRKMLELQFFLTNLFIYLFIFFTNGWCETIKNFSSQQFIKKIYGHSIILCKKIHDLYKIINQMSIIL